MLCEVMSAKHAQVLVEKNMNGANGQIGGKNHSNTFVLTAFIPLANLTFTQYSW
jgi:hypothetical protein